MKEKTTSELVMRMNEINKSIDMLLLEYNQIVKELCVRYPNLKNEVDMQPKIRIKEKRNG